MENKKVIAVIDLGTFNLKCAIFSFSIGELPQLIGFSKKKTKGIHNSIIVNMNDAIDSVRSCLIEAEKKSQISLNKINVKQNCFLVHNCLPQNCSETGS